MIKSNNYYALIIGVDSLIGNALYRRLTSDGQLVVGTTRHTHLKHIIFDLSELEKINDLPFARYVFICAGVNGFKACEENTFLATKINFFSTCQIAKHFLKLGSHVVFFSSSSVFGSYKLFPTEDEIVNPNTEYGRLKALAEQQMSNDAHFCNTGKLTIIRLTKVLESLAPLIDIWINKSRSGVSIEAYIDYYLCPISMGYVLDSVVKLCKIGAEGTIHLSGTNLISYYDLLREYKVNHRFRDCEIIGIPAKGLPLKQVNQCISLGMSKTSNLYNISPENLIIV